MKLRRILPIFLVFIMVISLVACKADEGNQEVMDPEEVIEDIEEEVIVDNTPVEGGQVAIPLTKFASLNPLLTENINYYFFSKLIYESLFDFDDNLNMTNVLAKTYQILEDGRTIEVELKEDIYWHDGVLLTPDDVIFTINTIKYAGSDTTYKNMFASALGTFSPADIRRIMDVKIIDENKLAIIFDRAFSNNLEVLSFPIIPKHIYTEGKAVNRDYASALLLDNFTPIGTGPYKFVDYEKMKKVSLTANDLYREGKPYITSIIGLILDSEEDILTAFETGQVSMGTTIGADWDKYYQNDRIKIYEFISNNYEFLGFNFKSPIFEGEEGLILRRAIAYGIDRQGLIQKLYLGHGSQIDVPIHPDSWLVSDVANSYGYNTNQAMDELNKLDLENKTIRLLTNTYNPARLKAAELIKEDLEKLGLEVTILPEARLENPTASDIEKQWEDVNKELLKGNYDIGLLGWQLSAIPELSFAFHSSQIKYETNFINYANERMDQALETGFLDGNRENKEMHYNNLQRLIVEDLPYFSLFFKNKALLIDSKINGNMNPSFTNPYRGIEKAFIPKDFQ